MARTGAFSTDSDGGFIYDYDGDIIELTGTEVDFFDSPRGREAYDASDRDISDLWVTKNKPFATTDGKVFEIVGWNSDGREVPHSGISLPKYVDNDQFAYLPNYIRPGDEWSLDFRLQQGGITTSEGNTTTENGNFRFHFGVGGSKPEYGNHYTVRFDNRSNPPSFSLARETERWGGYETYEKVNINKIQPDQWYSVTIRWNQDGHFEAWFKGKHITTYGTGNKTKAGRGIGYECSPGTRWWVDSVKLLNR